MQKLLLGRNVQAHNIQAHMKTLLTTQQLVSLAGNMATLPDGLNLAPPHM
jgi:hypothetical protein